MPYFTTKRSLTLLDNSHYISLHIILKENEHLTNDILDSVFDNVSHLSVSREPFCGKSLLPIRIECSPSSFGRLCLKSFCVYGVIEKIDDFIFESCRQLEYLYIGGSSCSLFQEDPMNLLKQPLKIIHLNGYGIVQQGQGLMKLVDHVRQRYGDCNVSEFF